MESVVVVGCGNMGHALVAGFADRAVPAGRIHIVEPDKQSRYRAAGLGVNAVADLDRLPPDLVPSVVLIAIKPQQVRQVLPAYGRYGNGGTTFLSVLAGTDIAALEALVGGSTPIVRCMPNTPAAIGCGITVCCANDRVTATAMRFCRSLLAETGEVRAVDDEALMDAVTGVSGSGPAYVFHMIECLAEAGIAQGLPGELARDLALETVYGAGQLAKQSEETPASLRQRVTSPNGTTAAGLAVLMGHDGDQSGTPGTAQSGAQNVSQGGLCTLLKRTVAAATARSRALRGM